MYLAKVPDIFSKIFPSIIWHMPRDKNKVYFTFDDGPSPEATPIVLEILNKYNIKATFFCIGKNVKMFPELYDQIIAEGHSTANHTFNHLNGWKTSKKKYVEDVEMCNQLVKSNLFRPPYGKINLYQISALKKKYKIIMYDLITKDFDNSVSLKKMKENFKKNCSAGSIVVFHDNLKSKKKVAEFLPWSIEQTLSKKISPEALKETAGILPAVSNLNL